jgi:hypothetical protein
MLHYQEEMVILLQDDPQLGRKDKALLAFNSVEMRSSAV